MGTAVWVLRLVQRVRRTARHSFFLRPLSLLVAGRYARVTTRDGARSSLRTYVQFLFTYFIYIFLFTSPWHRHLQQLFGRKLSKSIRADELRFLQRWFLRPVDPFQLSFDQGSSLTLGSASGTSSVSPCFGLRGSGCPRHVPVVLPVCTPAGPNFNGHGYAAATLDLYTCACQCASFCSLHTHSIAFKR